MSQTTPAAFVAVPTKLSFCNSGESSASPQQLSFQHRACWYASDLTPPRVFLQAGLSSALGQWHNDKYGTGQDAHDFAHRFGVFYARRGARDAAELVASYVNHEDPRPHASGEIGVFRRTKTALTSVLIAKTDAGSRPALTPIAGSFGSALVGIALSRQQDMTGGSILREAGIGYAGSFGTALYNEFKPDLSSFVRRALHKRKY